MYRIILKNPSSGDQYELNPLNFSFTDELNKESTARFTLSFEDTQKVLDDYGVSVLSAFTATYREIWIERKDSTGAYTKIFWGLLTNFEVSPVQGGQRHIYLNAVSWFGLFGRRYTGAKRVFSNTDAGTIAWTLISESQSSDSPYSDYGITQGSITSSKNRDRTYRFDNVKDSIIGLSNNNLKDGFDFEIDNTKAFNVYYPQKGSNKFNIIFDERNLANYRYVKPLILSTTNKVYVIGEGVNDDFVYVTRNADNQYKSDFKLQESVLNERDVKETATLNDKGDRYLSLYQSPLVEFSVEHYDDDITWFDYTVGDYIKVNIPDLGLNNETRRVMKKEFALQEDKSIGYIRTTLSV